MISSLKQQPVSPASRSAQWLERLGKCRGLDQCVFGGGGGSGFKSPWTHDGKDIHYTISLNNVINSAIFSLRQVSSTSLSK